MRRGLFILINSHLSKVLRVLSALWWKYLNKHIIWMLNILLTKIFISIPALLDCMGSSIPVKV